MLRDFKSGLAAAASSVFVLMTGFALSQQAQAADRAPNVSAFTWAGYYAGAHIGFSLNDPELVASSFTTFSGLGQSAGISSPGSTSGRFGGGAQAGFNTQTDIWVYGAEADVSSVRRRIGTNASSNLNFAAGTIIQNFSAAEAEADWYGTVRGRLGVARDRWLVYASGGFAYGEVQVTNTSNSIACCGASGSSTTSAVTTSHIKAGWAAGAGAAYAWSDNVSLFAEWTRIDLGSDTAQTLPPAIVTGAGSITFLGRSDVVNRFDAIQAGVNVKLY